MNRRGSSPVYLANRDSDRPGFRDLIWEISGNEAAARAVGSSDGGVLVPGLVWSPDAIASRRFHREWFVAQNALQQGYRARRSCRQGQALTPRYASTRDGRWVPVVQIHSILPS